MLSLIPSHLRWKIAEREAVESLKEDIINELRTQRPNLVKNGTLTVSDERIEELGLLGVKRITQINGYHERYYAIINELIDGFYPLPKNTLLAKHSKEIRSIHADTVSDFWNGLVKKKKEDLASFFSFFYKICFFI